MHIENLCVQLIFSAHSTSMGKKKQLSIYEVGM